MRGEGDEPSYCVEDNSIPVEPRDMLGHDYWVDFGAGATFVNAPAW